MKIKLLIFTSLIVGLEVLLVPFSNAGLAKAYFASQSEMLKNSQIIAVVDVKKVETSGLSRSYTQKATADVEQILKGSAGKQIMIYGGEDFKCAQCLLKPGKTLVFLNQDNNFLIGSNWQLSVKPIENGQLGWYAGEHYSPQKLTKLEDVLTSIKAKLPKPIKLSPPLAALINADTLDDGATGEAPESSKAWQAYRAILPVAAQHKGELEYIFAMGKPGGRIYAAMLLNHADKQATEKPGQKPAAISSAETKTALQTLSVCNGSVVYRSGCKGFPTAIREVANKLSGEGQFMSLKLE